MSILGVKRRKVENAAKNIMISDEQMAETRGGRYLCEKLIHRIFYQTFLYPLFLLFYLGARYTETQQNRVNNIIAHIKTFQC